ncbi:hypothetical protein HanRHA438_Chr01g0012831 [Helianthus annuus]|nr:hypothetical protein HanRHA438_Chr01g0012831 [Helianthus annuus]
MELIVQRATTLKTLRLHRDMLEALDNVCEGHLTLKLRFSCRWK